MITDEQLQELLDRIEALEQRSLPFPLDPLNRRIVNRDLPVVKSIDTAGDTFVVEVNDREYTWDFGAIGGGGAKSVTLIVGPASNTDSAGYDYTTDGTDDDVQIQAAIDALPATGGTVLLREGTYTIGTTITLDGVGLRLLGVGTATILKPKTSLNSTVISVSTASTERVDNELAHFKIDGNSANQTSGVGVSVTTGCFIHHIHFFDILDTAIYCSSSSTISDCVFESIKATNDYALDLSGESNQKNCIFENNRVIVDEDVAYITVSDATITGTYFSIPDSYNQTFITGSNPCTIANCSFDVGASVGASCRIINRGGTTLALGNFITFAASANAASVAITVGTSSSVVGNTITRGGVSIVIGDESICSSNLVSGSVASSIRANGSRATVTANIVYNPGNHGIEIGASENRTIVSSNIIRASSDLSADNTYSAIYLNNSVERCVINSNTVYDVAVSNNFKYSIEETTSCDSNIITSNMADPGQTAQINIVGASTISANNITA